MTPRRLLWFTVIALLLFGFLNALVKEGSNMDSPLLDEQNLYVVAAHRGLQRGLSVSGDIRLDVRIKSVPGGRIDRDALRAAVLLCERTRTFFETQSQVPGIGVYCLSSAIDYAEDARPFLSVDDALRADFDADRWWQKLRSRHDIDGVLFQETPGGAVAMINLLVPSSVPDPLMYRVLKGFLEEREIGELTLMLSPAITVSPLFRRISVDGATVDTNIEIVPVGWPIARIQLYAVSREDLFLRIVPAIALFNFLITWVKLRSLRQAAVALAMVLFALLVCRGMIAILNCATPQEWDMPWREEIFTMLAYVVCLVPGFSFALRRFAAFNAASGGDSGERWAHATREIAGPFFIVAGISILDFLLFMALTSLDGARSLFQVGILSSIGLLVAWGASRYLLPTWYGIAGGDRDKPFPHSNGSATVLAQVLSRVSHHVLRWAQRPLAVATSIAMALVLVAIVAEGVLLGYLRTESDPRELLQATPVGTALSDLERPGQPGGFNMQVVHVLPRNGNVNDPAYAESLVRLASVLRGDPRVVAVSGPIDVAQRIVMSDFPDEWRVVSGSMASALHLAGQKTGRAPEEVLRDIWRDISNELPLVSRQMIGPAATVLFVAGHEASSRGMRELRTAAEEAGAQIPDVVVELPGKTSLYPEVDDAITNGVAGNIIMSILFLGIAAGWWLRKRQQAVETVRVVPLGAELVIALPFCAAIALLFIAMMALSIPLDIGSAAIAGVAVSVAVDFPIFLATAYARSMSTLPDKPALTSATVQREIETMLADALVNAPPFLVLCMSHFPPVYRLGVMFTLVIGTCAWATLFLVLPLLPCVLRGKPEVIR